MKLIFPLLFVVLLVSCVSTPMATTPKALKKFENWEAVNRFAKQRIAAIEKIHTYPTKSEFFEKFKFWKKVEEKKEIVGGYEIDEGFRRRGPNLVEAAGVPNLTSRSEGSSLRYFVDEGGIVKRVGDYMIVLLRGKLYSIHVGKTLSKVDEISVQQGNWTHDAYYDEMLAHNGKVIVVGSTEKSGAEYLYFDVDLYGKFTRGSINVVNRGSLNKVKSSVYPIDEYYTSLLVGSNLIFVLKDIPITEKVGENNDELAINLYISQVDSDGRVREGYPLLNTNDIYQPILSNRDVMATTVAVCPLNADSLHCSATTILGGLTSETYATRNAYYVWMTGSDWYIPFESMPDTDLKRYSWTEYLESVEDKRVSALYRIPYDGSDVGVVKTKGQPMDQFSFNEKNGKLMVLSRVITDKEYSLGYPVSNFSGRTYFSAIAPSFFGKGVSEYPESGYTLLADDDGGWRLNRFIGDSLLYIETVSDDTKESETARIKIFDTNKLSLLQDFDLSYSVNVIKKVGSDALLLSYEGDDSLRYSTLSLNDDRRIVDSKVSKNINLDVLDLNNVAPSYNSDMDGGVFAFQVDEINTIGQVSGEERDSFYYEFDPITTILYTKVNADLTVAEAGQLEGNTDLVRLDSDVCTVSCTDWHDSARPIFWDDRIFSLIKYELIEGKYANGKVSEVTRLNFK